MTNTEKLEKKIDESGLKVSYIAKKANLSRSALYKKIKNINPFNQYEIEALCTILKIVDLEEKEQIFFAN